MKLTKIAAALATTSVAGASRACGGGDEPPTASNYPSETLEWTIAFGPGGGNDIMARTIVDILQKEELYPEDIVVENRRGRQRRHGLGQRLSASGHGLRHLHDVRLVHHHAAAGRHRLDLRGLHARRACWPPTTRCSSTSGDSGHRHLGGLGRRTPRTRARSRRRHRHRQRRLHPAPDAGGRRRGTRSSTCPTTRRARCRPRCSSGALDAMVSNPGSSPRPGRVGRHEPAAVHR